MRTNTIKISWAAVLAYPAYYAQLIKKEQPEIKERKEVSPERKYSCDDDWMPQTTMTKVLDAYNEYKSGLL